MKKNVLLQLTLILVATTAMGQSLGQSDKSGAAFAPCTLEPGDITQSLDCSLVADTGVTCRAGSGISTDTQFLRRFLLNEDHGIVDSYTVDGVEFGLELLVSGPQDSGCPGNPFTVNCYSIRADRQMRYANLTLLDSTSANLHRAEDLSFVTVGLNGNCHITDPTRRNLVIEITSCDHLAEGSPHGAFFPGANDLGEIQPSYIAAPDCDIFEPEPLDDLGFPGSDYVWIIQGRERNQNQTGVFIGEPSALRVPAGVEISFSLEMEHLRGGGVVPLYVELQDLKGSLLAEADLGFFRLDSAEPSRVSDVLRVPASVSPGTYVLVGKIPTAERLVQFKKLVQIP